MPKLIKLKCISTYNVVKHLKMINYIYKTKDGS